jgi:hypothetical protein
MVDWNPVPHMQHAWARAHTMYGKAGLVVFYALIWFNIASAAWTLVDPGSQGMDCVIRSIKGAESQAVYAATLRALAVVMIGFFLYADTGGLQTKNVAVVAVVLITTYWIGLESTRGLGCFQFHWFCVAVIVWPVVALILAYLEAKLGGTPPQGSAPERTPLTV